MADADGGAAGGAAGGGAGAGAPATVPGGLHRCPVCFKTYKRREHLQRHRGSHIAERPHRCSVCGASFQRSDVLKRHLQTCDGASAPSSSRRRACDRCVRQKKACNSSQPCLNCEKRSVECRYSNPPASTSDPPTATSPSDPPLKLSPLQDDQLPADDALTHATTVTTATTATTAVTAAATTSSSSSIGPGPGFDPLHHQHFDALIQHAVSQAPLMPHHPMMHVDPNFFESTFPQFSHAPPPPGGIESFHHDMISAPSTSRYRKYHFDFLADFTSRTGLVSSFECATLKQRQDIVSLFYQRYHEQQQPQPPDLFWSVPSAPLASAPPALAGPQDAGLFPASVELASQALAPWLSWVNNPWVLRLQEVVLLVRSTVVRKPHNSSITETWSMALEQQCLNFFSPPRFAKFMELYWSVWHPNVNILHRPTFDPASAKAVLLASMALIGACVSPDAADNVDARRWFNTVEEMVFGDDDFCKDIDPPSDDDISNPVSTIENRQKLQALQAAYIVCLYQNWEGVDHSKRRIRRHRYSTVVSTARDLGINTARHLEYFRQSRHQFNWEEYVVREELVRIYMWIFLLDTAFVIFNNLPHRMVIKEMRMHLASPEACFQAETPDECYDQIQHWMSPESPFCSLLLRDAIENLCLDTMTDETHQQLSQLGPMNLFAMVSAIHYMIFQHQNLFGVEGQLVPIRNGLRNWIEIWDKYADLPPALSPHGVLQEDCPALELMWKRIGFVRFSPEYWLLGTLLTERLSGTAVAYADEASSQGSSPEASGSSRGKARSAKPLLEKYDQTSMRQVNDLIKGFAGFSIDSETGEGQDNQAGSDGLGPSPY
ncbi:hypothetical protein C8A05DRAFT_14485 [Staphylotrichum tortipilum]|uniref:Uncharacterized protein n=1 Tax=Staphylotrichum tortipilum TaxID=2831512 RepID=A0AAN6RVF2_9PEZI|nr:hypothetical protein C8A05DRAFT_14485 [Staphylotrichum longicolle]